MSYVLLNNNHCYFSHFYNNPTRGNLGEERFISSYSTKRDKIHHDWKDMTAETEQEVGLGYQITTPPLGDLLLCARLHSFRVPQPTN